MPQLDIFIFQNVTLYSAIIFFILSYNLYLILIKIFKILKTRILLNKVYSKILFNKNTNILFKRQRNVSEIFNFKRNQITNKFNLLVKEITEKQLNT